MSGWVPIPRSIIDQQFFRDADTVHLYLYLHLKAAYKPTMDMFDGQPIELQKGQLITGRKRISADLGMDESKVERILKRLQNACKVNTKKGHRMRLISIIYEVDENQSEHQTNAKRTKSERQTNTFNKKEKDNNKNNDKIIIYDENENLDIPMAETIRHPVCQYIIENLPNVSTIRDQMSDEQADKLDREFNRNDIINVLLSMENYNGIAKKYNTVYLTCLNWLKNRKDNGKQTQRTKTYSDYLRENGVEP